MWLIHPSHLSHCTEHKYYTQYRQKGCLQIVSRQKSWPLSRNSILMGDITSSTIGGFQAINATHRTPIWPLVSLMKTQPIQVAIISAWRRSVFPCSKLMNLSSTHLEFSIHSQWPAAEVFLPQPSYVTSLCMQVGHWLRNFSIKKLASSCTGWSFVASHGRQAHVISCRFALTLKPATFN